MRLEYLPPYSPDFNPIEEGFSAFKAWLRRNRYWAEQAFRDGNPYTIIWAGIYQSMTCENIRGWFKHAGYV
jgi:transposase